MEYKKLLELGFKRIEYKDEVHEELYGFPAFNLEFEKGDVCLVWHPVKPNEVRMSLFGKRYKTLYGSYEVEEVLDCINK